MIIISTSLTLSPIICLLLFTSSFFMSLLGHVPYTFLFLPVSCLWHSPVHVLKLSHFPQYRVMQTALTLTMTGLPVILRKMISRKTLCISQVLIDPKFLQHFFLYNKDCFYPHLCNYMIISPPVLECYMIIYNFHLLNKNPYSK